MSAGPKPILPKSDRAKQEEQKLNNLVVRLKISNASISNILIELFKDSENLENILDKIIEGLPKPIPTRAVRKDFPLTKFKILFNELKMLSKNFTSQTQEDILKSAIEYWWDAEFIVDLEKKTSPIDHYDLMLEKIKKGLIIPLYMILDDDSYNYLGLSGLKDQVIRHFEGLNEARNHQKGPSKLWHILNFTLDTLPKENKAIIYNKGLPDSFELNETKLQIRFPKNLSEVIIALYDLNVISFNADEIENKLFKDTKVALVKMDGKTKILIELDDQFNIRAMFQDVGQNVSPEIQSRIKALFKRQGYDKAWTKGKSQLNLTVSEKNSWIRKLLS